MVTLSILVSNGTMIGELVNWEVTAAFLGIAARV
jgi:hypothetical protein